MRYAFRNFLDKSVSSYKSLPEKKQYIEFFTALLSVPVMATVILLNLNNLRVIGQQPNNNKQIPSPTPVKELIYVSPQDNLNTETVKPTNTPIPNEVTPTIITKECIKEIPSVTIQNPKENETVTGNPVNVTISNEKGDYCAVVWAYRINNGRWSDYDDKSIALYNLPSGTTQFELKVKSIATGEEQTITRTFSYTNENAVPIVDIEASVSAH